MDLFERFSHLAKADAHGVVDALEDRALVLRQHLREASAEVARKRDHLDSLASEDQDLATEDRQLEARLEQLDRDVALALGQDAENLARFAIKRLLPLRHTREQIAWRRQRLAQEQQDLAACLSEQQAQLEDLERRVRGYLARAEKGEAGHTFASELVITDEDVELELLRRSQAPEGGV